MKLILALTFSLFLMPALTFGQETDLPGIYIVRNIDNTETLIPGLRARYQNCVRLKLNNMRLREESPTYWDIASQSVSAEYNSLIDAPPTREPLWADLNVGFERESEYFFQDQYVLINESFDYDFTEDGLCTLIKTKKEKRFIDNGIEVYKVTRKTAAFHHSPRVIVTDPWMDNVDFVTFNLNQYESAAITGPAANQELNNELNNNEELRNRIAELLGPDAVGGVTPPNGTSNSRNARTASDLRQLAQAIREVFDLQTSSNSPTEQTPITGGTYSAAGQSCDLVESQRINQSICYWSTAHVYPSYSQRPIILRKEYRNVRAIAERFEFISSIPEDIITPPEPEAEPVLDRQ